MEMEAGGEQPAAAGLQVSMAIRVETARIAAESQRLYHRQRLRNKDIP